MTKSRKIEWTRYVACIEDRPNENIIIVRENLGNTSHLKGVGTDGRKYIMITITSNSMVGGFGLDSSSSGASGELF